jgi:hypothetical protein
MLSFLTVLFLVVVGLTSHCYPHLATRCFVNTFDFLLAIQVDIANSYSRCLNILRQSLAELHGPQLVWRSCRAEGGRQSPSPSLSILPPLHESDLVSAGEPGTFVGAEAAGTITAEARIQAMHASPSSPACSAHAKGPLHSPVRIEAPTLTAEGRMQALSATFTQWSESDDSEVSDESDAEADGWGHVAAVEVQTGDVEIDECSG